MENNKKKIYRLGEEEIRYTCSMKASPLDNDLHGKEESGKEITDENNILTETDQTSVSYIFNFDKFITFEGNIIAVNAAKKVAYTPERSYNPLFIYGKHGTGKTHLLKAIAGAAIQNNPSMNVMYVTAETFCNDVIAAIRYGNSLDLSEIRDIYRGQDILLVDDIQFLSGKDATLSEMSFTIDSILGDGNQIVFASDVPPKELDMNAHMKAQMSSGLISEIKEPDYKMKQNIIRVKAGERGVYLPEEVIDYISSNVGSNTSEIEGALTSIVAYLELYRPEITLDTAKMILKDVIESNDDIRD